MTSARAPRRFDLEGLDRLSGIESLFYAFLETSVPFISSTDLSVIHVVRVKGLAGESSIVEATGLSESAVRDEISQALEDGLVVYRDGRIRGWTLTPSGREVHRKRLGDELIQAGCRVQIEAGYESFLGLNEPLKALCTKWQLENKPRSCVRELDVVHRSARTVVASLSSFLSRFGPYGNRLGSAVTRFRAGDIDALTKPMYGSYHDCWMELHEDLLLTLGRERNDARGN